MRSWHRKRRCALTLALGLTLQPIAAVPALAQHVVPGGPNCPPPPCLPAIVQPLPTPATPTTPAPQPGQPTQPAQPTQPEEPQTAPTTMPEPSLGAEQASAGGAATFAAPNMIGHLLMATRSVNFRYNRAAGPINVANNGSTTVVNPAVADNNSPIPRDRFGFRYNHFDNAQQVTGFGPAVFGPDGIGTAFAQTRDYNLDSYTFQLEKTFLDRMASVELRIPFSTGLAPDLDLSAGSITGPALGPDGQPIITGNGPAFNVMSTPGQTLGSDATQFGNMSVILKGLAYCSQPLAITGGLAVGIPTGPGTTVDIVDYSGGTTQGNASVQRHRRIDVDNETWSLSPFVAFLSTPTERFFTQGFAQLDIPLNPSSIEYAEGITRGTVFPLPPVLARYPTLTPPFAVGSSITDQPLLQLDWGFGYWLLRDESRTWLTGIAPSFELHYTTTLRNASVVTLPGDPFLQIDPANPGRLVQEEPPQVGNLRNRMDILDATVATTFLLGDRATLATGVSLPLRGSENRTFDWEYHLQLNYYFGGVGRRFAPNY